MHALCITYTQYSGMLPYTCNMYHVHAYAHYETMYFLCELKMDSCISNPGLPRCAGGVKCDAVWLCARFSFGPSTILTVIA